MHTNRILLEKGCMAGAKAFFRRMKSCKGGYVYAQSSEGVFITTVNKSIIKQGDMNPFVLEGVEASIKSYYT